MAISSRNSRKIVVNNHEFRWKATGDDGWINLAIWPADNKDLRLIGTIGYHSQQFQKDNPSGFILDQIVITNRIVREVILHFGVEEIFLKRGNNDIGPLENILDPDSILRSSD